MPVVTLHPSGGQIWLDHHETVLEVLFKAGYAYTVGCRRGGCAICTVTCLHGEFAYNRPLADTVLTDEERLDGPCLSCRAVPITDRTIELRGEDVRLVNPFLRSINERARLRAQSVAPAKTKEH